MKTSICLFTKAACSSKNSDAMMPLPGRCLEIAVKMISSVNCQSVSMGLPEHMRALRLNNVTPRSGRPYQIARTSPDALFVRPFVHR